MPPQSINGGASYFIDLSEFGISNDGTDADNTRKGINDAIIWAKDEGYSHIVLPGGIYQVSLDPSTLTAINMVSDMHLEMSHDCEIRLEGNSSPSYAIFNMTGIRHAKLSGGKIVGDKKVHRYEMYVKFVRGGINADGSLNNNASWIRSEVIDRYDNPGLLSSFRVWGINGVTAPGYQFYQYKDVVMASTLVGFRTNGIFAPSGSNGRGWILDEEGIDRNNKMVIAIKPTSPLTNAQIAALQAKIDHFSTTHESGHGISIRGSNHVDITGIDISNCTGDGIFSSWEKYHIDPTQYTQEQMGQHVNIKNCDIHHCRRQGISICSTNDTHIYRNRIHHIGFDDDDITTNFRNGTLPMYGIDIESMLSEMNIPVKSEDRPDGLELNNRIFIKDNYIYSNARGHFVNTDGTDVLLEGNNFEGYNVGGINSNANYANIRFVNNIFDKCELWVQGDNFVDGAVFRGGNLRFLNVLGATVNNCRIKDGLIYGSSLYGYFGSPLSITDNKTFTYATPHGMGNGAKVVFEQWVGKVPIGISIDKIYFIVNKSANAFQVSETLDGPAVVVSDQGVIGYNISRYNYGRCYLSNIVLERDWRPDNNLTPNLNLLLAGAVINNVTVKNYDVALLVPANYVGRPNVIKGITLIEGYARFEGCHIESGEFIRNKTTRLGGDIQFGSNSSSYVRENSVRSALFQGVSVVLEGPTTITNSIFFSTAIGKSDGNTKAKIVNSYLENTKVNMNWLRKNNSFTLAASVLKGVTITGSSPYVVAVNNTEIADV
ncbi:right-handed parallel beta-helix repeat-containing protein [Paenibacillus sp. GSMTC-2017]|uniref:right-handed parallel beta-helix repeat-containing protein n=1 Tax=Paenibacillus sp. GSMTC-2017 TaxID=2794350 RepID=UPI0018D6FDCC|nr:right-handed parallel beta-helix repeat-containing protein [Paenibacillus sp. GSMTC-2017]MBH5317292.1 right-handed parallel beta-helix repeat-containing protein [Paenibacillus sp. GSMTC-2017]